jgi:hypothetical protein
LDLPVSTRRPYHGFYLLGANPRPLGDWKIPKLRRNMGSRLVMKQFETPTCLGATNA